MLARLRDAATADHHTFYSDIDTSASPLMQVQCNVAMMTIPTNRLPLYSIATTSML